MSQFKFRPISGSTFVVQNIIAMNVIFFIAKYLAEWRGIRLMDILGLHQPMSPLFKWHQFLTHMFMHYDLMHIVFNMFGVYFFGRMLENVWGSKRFLLYYLVCGLGGGIVHISWEIFRVASLAGDFTQGWEILKGLAVDPSVIPMNT